MFLMKMTMSCFKIITSQAVIVMKSLSHTHLPLILICVYICLLNNIREQKVKAAEKISEGHRWRGFSEEECVGSGKSGPTDEEKLKRSLFGDDEGPPLEDIAEEDEQPEEEDIGDEDDMADFIVNEEVHEHGAPVRRGKLNKKKARQAPGVSSSALQEAYDIFGDVDEGTPQAPQARFSKDGQIYGESTGSPPSNEMSIEEESNLIYNQLMTCTIPLLSEERTLYGRFNVSSVSSQRMDELEDAPRGDGFKFHVQCFKHLKLC
ncbi:global transcription factor group B1 [Actinidia rufa]|uniref:Global transcription factor group B1 n=1 Tax=Actinidia rufa TaxID=165716 RepID=A0A7J0DWU6_9ERIC|nr:global transcription factor group B1 [Actinidia rufa]